MNKDQGSFFVEMGYVSGVVGIKGWLKIKADTESPESLLSYPTWYLGKNGDWKEYKYVDGKITGKGLQVKLSGIDDRNIAETLVSLQVVIPRECFAETQDNEYYWVDLVGMSVFNLDGELLGVVDSLIDNAAHDILLVKNDQLDHSLMIPFIDVFISEVNREKNQIIADWQIDY